MGFSVANPTLKHTEQDQWNPSGKVCGPICMESKQGDVLIKSDTGAHAKRGR